MARPITPPLRMSRGRKLLLALLQRTTARDVAARCRVYPQRVADWWSGYRVPAPDARKRLESQYGIPAHAWDEEWRDPTTVSVRRMR